MGKHVRRRHRVARVALGVAGLLALTGGVVAFTVDSAAGPSPGGSDQVRILALGDSITNGSTKPPKEVPGGYRGVLDGLLRDAGLDPTWVGTSTGNPPASASDNPLVFKHDGWPGARVEELDEALLGPSRLDGGHWLDGVPGRDPIDPDVVVLIAGTNDVVQHYDPDFDFRGGPHDPSEVNRFVADLIGRLRHLIDSVAGHDPSTRFVVCTIPPMASPTAAAYNEAIRSRLVPGLTEDGVPVALADLERALVGHPELIGPDAVHPTPAGYDVIARLVAPAVLQVEQP